MFETPFASRGTVVLLAVLFIASAYAEHSAAAADGLVVFAVGTASEAEAAGIVAGDRLVAWQDESVGQWTALATPYDLDLEETRCGEACVIVLRGERDGNPATWRLRAGDWRLTTVPADLGARADDDSLDSAKLAALQQRASAPGVLAWVGARLLVNAAIAGQWESFAEELAALETLPDASYRLVAIADAVDTLSRSIPRERMQPLIDTAGQLITDPSVSLAARLRAQVLIGYYLARTGHLGDAIAYLADAARRIDDAGLVSPFVADARTVRSTLAIMSGELDMASAMLERAIDALDLSGGRTAYTRYTALRNLAIIATYTSQYDEAERYSTEALRLVEQTKDRGSQAQLLNNLGILLVKRGDMARAEYYYQRAMRLNESLGAWLNYAYNLTNLGDIAIARGDNERAESLFQTARDTILEQSPDTTDAAQVTTMLAHSQFELGKLDAASENYRWSMALYERVAPGSLFAADARIGLGDVMLLAGDVTAALRWFGEALEIRASKIPGSLEHAEAVTYLGTAQQAAGDVDAAKASYEAAAAILRDLAPDTIEYAKTLFQLAQLTEAAGDTESALRYYEASVAAAERQTEQLGGADDSRVAFAADYAELFDSYVRLLLALGRDREAFDAVERYQARLLLTMLAERESTIRFSLPAELVAERRQREQDYADARDELLALVEEGADAADIDRARQAVVEREVARNALTQRLRAVAEGFAQLRYPEPLTLQAAQRALDPGTLALLYRVTDDDATLFVIARDRFEAVALDASAADLRDLVRRFRLLIDIGRLGGPPDDALLAIGRQLYAALVTPAGGLDAYNRLLVVADGPLHVLPFGALVEPAAGDGAPRYLIEALPVHRTLSLTLYDELRRQAPQDDGQLRLAAFANAASGSSGDAVRSYVSSVLAAARELDPLPWSRDEVQELAALYGDDTVFASAESATEAEFVRYAANADIVHVAAHAVVDERSPLDSALVFRLGADAEAANDGLLQAWEVFDRLQLDASLVVLSACRSGFGRETSSEGLLGLQRAFLYAGTRSVVSSLWNVADRSTRDLMVAFHHRLNAGSDIDSALRDAQLALLRGKEGGQAMGLSGRALTSQPDVDFSHPYHWAAFELSGDYRRLKR